ncbi:hypothetical protein ACFO6U_00360 [Enterococcus canintestini]|uniref:Uncharacterized protein n=1 Tax=Enterococcus canintestini TaxID=317010 RepID=A0A1L8R6H8_9ENTE|nr:hypothetical protein RU96_GL002405 [Enterococcus canintestini]
MKYILKYLMVFSLVFILTSCELNKTSQISYSGVIAADAIN